MDPHLSNELARVGRGPFDILILEGFAGNKSAEEVAELTGGVLTPAQCLARLTKLVRSKDVLESKDRLSLLLEDAYYLRNRLRQQMDDREYIDKDSAAIWLKTLEMIIGRVEAANAGLSDQMLKFNEIRAQEFIESLTTIVVMLMGELAQRHPEIEAGEVNEIVLEAIPNAIPEVK